MGDRTEEQLEEVEALEQIYEDDEGALEVVSREPPITVRITVEEPEHGDTGRQAVTLEAELPSEYPGVLPRLTIVGDHIPDDVKEAAVAKLKEEGEALLDMAMLSSLAEVLKESMEELGVPCEPNAAERAAAAAKEEEAKRFASMSAWERMQAAGGADRAKDDDSGAGGGSGGSSRHGGGGGGRKKPKLTKAQKKKQLEAQEAGRGHDWVDVVAHLRRTGQKAS